MCLSLIDNHWFFCWSNDDFFVDFFDGKFNNDHRYIAFIPLQQPAPKELAKKLCS